jgi:hypothetical protein
MKMMIVDLCRYGFVPGYEVWIFYVEKATQAIKEEEEDYSTRVDGMDEILEDILQQRLKHSSSFLKLQKSRCRSAQK